MSNARTDPVHELDAWSGTGFLAGKQLFTPELPVILDKGVGYQPRLVLLSGEPHQLFQERFRQI